MSGYLCMFGLVCVPSWLLAGWSVRLCLASIHSNPALHYYRSLHCISKPSNEYFSLSLTSSTGSSLHSSTQFEDSEINLFPYCKLYVLRKERESQTYTVDCVYVRKREGDLFRKKYSEYQDIVLLYYLISLLHNDYALVLYCICRYNHFAHFIFNYLYY